MPMMNDQLFTIQAKVVVETAPSQASDGSYTDYGVWRMDVKVLEAGMPFRFVASAARDAQGRAVIKMGQVEPGKNGTPLQTAGILYKAAQSGSGKVVYPDWEACNQPDCVPAEVPVAYVYDAQTVTLRKGTGQAVTKARNSFVDIVNRYGLFDADDGRERREDEAVRLPHPRQRRRAWRPSGTTGRGRAGTRCGATARPSRAASRCSGPTCRPTRPRRPSPPAPPSPASW